MKCSELSFYICKFFNNTLTECDKKELAGHLTVCQNCKERVNIILPTLVCMNKYLSEDIVFYNISNYIIKAIQENQDMEMINMHMLKPEVIM